jgi:NADH dehydrogenase (ubiquinone) Fe-S protein 4
MAASLRILCGGGASMLRRSFAPVWRAEATDSLAGLPVSAREMLTGIPAEQLTRPVVIYYVAVTPMQSGSGRRRWRLEFDDPGLKWQNPMMGWTSTRDPTSQLRLDFDSEAEAISYAQRLGLKYTVKQDNKNHLEFDNRLYDDNFKWKGTGEEPTDKIFD